MESKREYLKVEAYRRGKPGEVADSLSVGIDVIGQTDYKADPYHFIPTTLSIYLGGDNGDDGDEDIYLEWRGFGSIDEEETRFVDFLFRGPDTSGGGFFTERDEYYLNYYEPQFDILLGDQSYDLSRLTADFSYGRGFGVNYRPGDGDLEIGGHYVEDRDDSSDEERVFYASYRVKEDLDLRLNYLDKREMERSRLVKDEIWSLEADYGLGKYGQLLVEYGISDSTRPGSDEDDAYLVEYSNTLFNNVSLYANRIHAGIDYEGYYNGYDYTSAFLGFPLAQNLRMGLSYTDYEDLVDPDETATSFNEETSWRAYLDYSMGGWYANLGYERFERTDQLVPKDSDYSEYSIWLRVGRSLTTWSYMLEARTGERDDHLTDETSRGWNYRIYITHRPSDSLFFTLFADLGDDQASDIRGLRTSSRLGFSASLQIRQNWLLNVWYTRSGLDSDTDEEEDEYELRTFYTLRNGHSLEFAVRHEIRENSEDETEYLLTYNIPIKIKTERRKNLGTIEGRIYDAQAEGNPGLANVVVKSQGRSTVTAADGTFILSPLMPGEHVLEIDRQSIGWNRVPKMKSPIVNDIKGMGETTNVEIGITDCCSINGKVVAVPLDKDDSSENGSQEEGYSIVGSMNSEVSSEPRPLPNILVEIKAGDHVIRRLTDSEGEFNFEDLYPDGWTLTVYDKSLPAYTYIEDATQSFILEPGEDLAVTKRVLPKVRRIEMLVQGEKITSEKISVTN